MSEWTRDASCQCATACTPKADGSSWCYVSDQCPAAGRYWGRKWNWCEPSHSRWMCDGRDGECYQIDLPSSDDAGFTTAAGCKLVCSARKLARLEAELEVAALAVEEWNDEKKAVLKKPRTVGKQQ